MSGLGRHPPAPGVADPRQDLPERPDTLEGMKKSVFTRYRIMAYVTGVLLVALTFGMIGKYALKLDAAEDFTQVVSIAHGWLYVVYLIFAFDLGSKLKWPVKKQLWVLLAGTVPTAAFFVERKVSRELEGKLADEAPAVA